MLYNQQSVLENHHIATAMALTSRPELDWISPLPAADQASPHPHPTLTLHPNPNPKPKPKPNPNPNPNPNSNPNLSGV